LIEVDCTVCSARDTTPAFEVDGWKIVRCRRCGHLYVNPRPPIEDVQRLYDEHYFQNPAFTATDHDAYFGYMDYLRDRENIQRRLRDVLARVEAHVDGPPGRLLDVGCGPGFFVEVAALAGWDAWGVDLNKHAVEWANEHVTDRVRHGTADALEFDAASFDCVTLFDVVEHLDDPARELAQVAQVVRPGGLLVVVTPDAGALVSRLLGRRWLELKRTPEHLHFFSRATLALALAGAGFRPLEWHSIGKITTVRTMLADLKFYAPRFFGAVERLGERRGWNERVVDLDPRTKMCVYARRL
jgi:2-polyprenyl-3-methyl-5-hydroxy-6-metoxy-1,4-benzoquinol methylase